ncbi:DUF2142 domain-containing protein [Candidatus Saccharibacteria bacterium]|nr:DUF2142 domain-containing protein [Candidatus Saccharibacteria bacterium]MBQ6130449.1 DUF2142 domain-containing protein [Candidatus Saccharibacteria bacterium]
MKHIASKLSPLLKNPKLYLIVVCGLLLTLSVRHTLSVNSVGHSLIVVPIILTCYLGFLWVFFYLRKRQTPIEKLFLLFAIPLGIFFIIFLPPGESPDEISHFKRAYAITEGHFVSEVYDDTRHAGAQLPAGFQDSLVLSPEPGTYSTVISKLSESIPTETDYAAFNNTSLYHWLCYLPQILGILLGKTFGASLELIAYFAEIADFIVWLILGYFAIKLAPKYKTIIVFLLLLPVTLQEATSLAPDALAIGLGLFLTSYVCHLTYVRKTRLKSLEIVLLYVMAILVGYCKIVYLPIVILYLLIPETRFGSKRTKWIHASALIILLLVLNLSWLATSSQFLREFNPGVDSAAQLSGILHNPLRYLMVLFNSLNVMGEFYFSSLLGMNLGSFTFNLPAIFFFISYGLFIVLFAQRDENLKIKPFERILFGATFCLISLLIFTSIYIQWSPVGLPYVDGVQGRYFIPILLLVPLAIIPTHSKSSSKQRSIVTLNTIACYSLALNLIAITMFFAQNL